MGTSRTYHSVKFVEKYEISLLRLEISQFGAKIWADTCAHVHKIYELCLGYIGSINNHEILSLHCKKGD